MLNSLGEDQNRKLMGRKTGILTQLHTIVRTSSMKDEEIESKQQLQDLEIIAFPLTILTTLEEFF